jgi:riboflavin kinase/FMN adenylyltransferase
VNTQLIRHAADFTLQSPGCVATIGNFDGVHRGHQVLLERVRLQAQARQLLSLVITFEPQPFEFFAREKSVARLTRFREKFYYLAQTRIDKVWVMRFNAVFAKLTAEEFIEKVLCEQMGVKHLIVGDDFRFGCARKGNVALLEKAGQGLGFTVEVMPSVCLEAERISSTRVRQALSAANHALAERLLGHPYCMLGRVVYGNQLGRVLGFPTANINLHRQVTPVRGVYIVRLQGIAKKGLPGVANVGIRPAIGGTRILLEVHVFDFAQNIYGKQVRVEFCEKLRDEEYYATLDLLKEQIAQDAAQARNYFLQRSELLKK